MTEQQELMIRILRDPMAMDELQLIFAGANPPPSPKPQPPSPYDRFNAPPMPVFPGKKPV